MLKFTPVAKVAPPVDAANQVRAPAEAVAPRVTEPLPQRLLGVLVTTVGIVFTVAKTAVLVAETQEPLSDSA